MAVPAVAAVAAAGAFAVPYLLSLGSSTSARTAGQAAAAAAGRGMTSLSMTPDRTVNAAGLPSSVRAAGNRYWTRHAAAASGPKKPAQPARPAHAAQPAQAADRSGQPTAKDGSSSGGQQQQALVTSTSRRGVTCTGSGGTLKPLNYGAIVTFLTAHGYSGNAASGIAGNIYAESGGNPESAGDGGGGLIGWTPLPGGYVTGSPAADLHTQLDAILTFNQIWAQYIPALNAAGSPAQAADIYVTDFERAGIPAYGTREEAAAAVARACGI
jgi:hypothetical protein